VTTVSIRTVAEFSGFNGLDIVAVVTAANERYALDLDLAPDAARIVVDRADWTSRRMAARWSRRRKHTPGDHILLLPAPPETTR